MTSPTLSSGKCTLVETQKADGHHCSEMAWALITYGTGVIILCLQVREEIFTGGHDRHVESLQ